jgi:hypothetical protein
MNIFILLFNKTAENEELLEIQQQSLVTLNYIILHTRWEDILLSFMGWIVILTRQWFKDSSIFEKKKHLAFVDPQEFFKKYKEPATWYINNSEWSWKLWWKDHDQNFITSFVCSFALIIAVPEGWDYIKTLFGDHSDAPFNSFISLLIGMFGLPIADSIMVVVNKLLKKYKNAN